MSLLNRPWFVLTLLGIVFITWKSCQDGAVVVRTPEMLAPEQPRQTSLSAGEAPVFQVKDYRIEAQARYSLQARLLGKKRYRFDQGAALSPIDLALGWGPMSANALVEKLDLSQSGRFYWVHWPDSSVSRSEVMENSANTHIIPATPHLAEVIDKMRPGQLIELKGYLVNVSHPNGWQWNSSLTRKDTGSGACELIWVESARIVLANP